MRTLAPPHAEECRANGEDPEGIAIPARGGGCQLHALLRPACRRSPCARERPTRAVPRQPHSPSARERPFTGLVVATSSGTLHDPGLSGAADATLTARPARPSQDPHTGSDCGAAGPPSSADRTHPSRRADERCICKAADGGPSDLADAGGDASSRMMRKQDKGGPFFWSRLESLTNPWPISIRVGQSGPRLSSAPSCTELASRPTSGGPVGLRRGPTRAFRNGSRPDRSTAQRRTAGAADQRPVDHHLAASGAPSADSSGADNEAQARRDRAHREHLPRRWPARATDPCLLAEDPSAVARILRRIPENAQRLLRIPPSFILLSQPALPTSCSHLSDSASRRNPAQLFASRPATTQYAVRTMLHARK